MAEPATAPANYPAVSVWPRPRRSGASCAVSAAHHIRYINRFIPPRRPLDPVGSICALGVFAPSYAREAAAELTALCSAGFVSKFDCYQTNNLSQ
jgi:hypothetical protein